MSERYKTVLSVRISMKLLGRIDDLVEKTGVSRADVIERALAVGLGDQEAFVKGLEGSVTGPLLELMLNQKFLNVVYAFTGQEVDPNQMTVVKNTAEKRRSAIRKGKPVTG